MTLNKLQVWQAKKEGWHCWKHKNNMTFQGNKRAHEITNEISFLYSMMILCLSCTVYLDKYHNIWTITWGAKGATIRYRGGEFLPGHCFLFDKGYRKMTIYLFHPFFPQNLLFPKQSSPPPGILIIHTTPYMSDKRLSTDLTTTEGNLSPACYKWHHREKITKYHTKSVMQSWKRVRYSGSTPALTSISAYKLLISSSCVRAFRIDSTEN